MIGESVFFGINFTVVGNIHIGNDVLIATNSFMNFDVHDHSILIVNPGVSHHKENATGSYTKLDIENPIIRINTAFKGCSSLEKISVLPRIYHN